MNLFESWESIVNTIFTGVFAYFILIFFLRCTGKRTLSKMNAFDLVVTVALGSTLATIIVSKQTPLTDGIVALALLVSLQYLIAWSAVRSARFRQLIKSEPSLLFARGEFLSNKMREERVVREEILSAIRDRGILDLTEVEAVILETDGTFTVLKRSASAPAQSSLSNVKSA